MMNAIGFRIHNKEEQTPNRKLKAETNTVLPRPAVVEVFFPDRNKAYAYFNDEFSLTEGDIVFVEGAMANIPGIVGKVQYCFKIKPQNYKRIIAKADTDITGDLFLAGSHLLAFDREVIPYRKILSWVKAPDPEDTPYVYGYDGERFPLYQPETLKMPEASAQKGFDLYMENKVLYLSLDREKGHAIVKGSHIYELEFCYEDGDIYNLACDCYCVGHCKHELATVLQLREILEHIESDYAEAYKKSLYFAAVNKAFVLGNKHAGKITL